MSECGVCNNKINRVDVKIICNSCNGVFHGVCVSITKPEIEFLKNKKQPWICPSCDNQRRQQRYIDDDIISCGNVEKVTNELINNVAVFSANTQQSPVLKDVYELIKKNYRIMEQRFNNLDKALERIDKLVEENKILKDKVHNLEVKLDRTEQLSLNNSVEIFNLPLLQDEKLIKNTVISLFNNELKYSCGSESVLECFRVKTKTINKPGKVIVRFNNADIKSDIINVSRKTKIYSKSIDGNNNNVIYINQCVTKFKRDLFVKAKEAKLQLNYKYLWMRDATIMMRKEDGGKINYIKSVADLGTL